MTAIEEHALTPEAVEALVLTTQHEEAVAVAQSFERELTTVEKQIEGLTDALLKQAVQAGRGVC